MSDPAAASSNQFRLVAWNVFQGLHHRSTKRTMVSNPELFEHLQSLNADVLVLPEAWRYRQRASVWAEDVAGELGYELHQWTSDRPSRRRDRSLWRMVIMTRIPAVRLEDHVLSELGRLGRRAFVRVRLTDQELTLAGGHLYGIHALRRGPKYWLRERAELRQASAANDIIAGDLNMWGPVVRRDAGELRLAVKGRTFPAPRPHSQIDHLLVSSRVEVLESRVLPDMGSDHLAVSATLRRFPES